MAGKDTRTKFQGVYKRHEGHCALSVALVEGREAWKLSDCDCNGKYFGVAWDKRANRPRKTKHLSTATAARNARTDLQAALRLGRPAASSGMRFGVGVDKFKAAIKDGTALNKQGKPYRKGAKRDLLSTLDHLPEDWSGRLMDDVTGGDVQQAIDEWVAEGLSGSRIRTRVSAVRSLYRWARAREFTTGHPDREIQLPALDSKPRDRVADPAEFVTLLAPLADVDQVPLALAAYSSARADEIRRLDWADVDLDRWVLLLASGGGKSDAATRVIPVVRPLRSILRAAWMRQGRPKGGKVCPPLRASKSGELSTGQYLRRCYKSWEKINKAERKAARKDRRDPVLLTPINLQEGRHTCATWLDHAGVSPKVASVWMGHATPAQQSGAAAITLNRYTHVLAGELEKAAKQLDAFLAERVAAEEMG